MIDRFPGPGQRRLNSPARVISGTGTGPLGWLVVNHPGGGREPEYLQVDPLTGEPIPLSVPIATQPAPEPPAMPGPPPRRAIGPVIAVVSVVVLLAVLGGALLVALAVMVGGEGEVVAGDTESGSDITAPLTPPLSLDDIKVKPATKGWQGVLSPLDGVAYDVPKKGWTVESPGVRAGFEDESGPRTIMRGVSTFHRDACDGQGVRGRAGFMPAGDVDPARGVEVAAPYWAEAAAELPENSGKVQASPATSVRIADGELTAQMSSSVVSTAHLDSDCPAPLLMVTAVAFQPTPGGETAMFILFYDLGVDDQLSDRIANKIIASLRPHAG